MLVTRAPMLVALSLLALSSCAAEDGEPRDSSLAGDRDESDPPGASLGTYQLTFYWVANEADYAGADNTNVYTSTCSVISKVPSSFASALKLEGTGRLTDGRVVNYHKSCGCSSNGCYVVVDDEHPWGIGVQNRPLVPFRSIAVDKNKIAYGSWVYVPALDGVTIPEGPWGGAFEHDGCLQAADTGSAIVGKHFDFFVAMKSAYLDLVAELPGNVTVHAGGDRCDGTVVTPPPEDDDAPADDDEPATPDDDAVGDVCFPGPSGAGDTCLPVVALPPGTSGYAYPAPYQGNPDYRAPIAYLDLQAIPADTKLAPNFSISELAQTHKGRYAVVQPHAVKNLQALRTQLGALRINSGYRSPSYNSSVGGASSSRHMFGDGFDIDPLNVSLTTLENACGAAGGMLVEYTTHAHCDWRFDAVDPAFFGIAAEAPLHPEPEFAGEIVEEDDGSLGVIASGFDEGDPMLRWTALDGSGETILVSNGPTFMPPEGTARVRVLVGAQLDLEIEPRLASPN
jgi:3D (Asp-Asp-Asp) domain-containing protein